MTTALFRRTSTHYPALFVCHVLNIAVLPVDPCLVIPLWVGYFIARDQL